MTSTSGAGPGLRVLARNIMLTLGRQVAAILLGLLMGILLARLLGPTGNGQYAVAMLLPTMLATALNFGIAPANVYYVGRREVPIDTAVRTNLWLWAGLSVLGAVIGYMVVSTKGDRWFPGVPTAYLWIAIAVFPLTLMRDLVASLLQAIQDFTSYNKLMIVGPAVNLVLGVIALWVLDWSVSGALLAAVLGSAAGLSVAIAAIGNRMRTDPAPARESYVTRCLSYGWKSHLTNVLTFVNYRADILLLNFLLTPAATGIYTIAVQLAERLWVFSQSVSTVLLPRLSEQYADGEGRGAVTPLIARWVFMLSILGAVAMAVVAPLVVPWLFGDAYRGAVRAFLWLLPGIVMGGLARILANDIAARGLPGVNLLVSVVVVSLNIGGNLLLIPRMGISGAALATTIAYTVNAVMKLGIYSHISGVPWTRTLLIPRGDWAMLRRAIPAPATRRSA